MSEPLKAEAFLGTADSGVPLFNRDPGWLRTLQNMRVRPRGGEMAGGWLEARGGREGLRPAGGTATQLSASGYFSGFHQFTSPRGVAIGTANNGTAFGRDIGPRSVFRIFGSADNLTGQYPVVGTNVDTANHWWAFGSTAPFTRLEFNIAQGTGGSYSVVWEYWNGAAWTALTSVVAVDFKTSGVHVCHWSKESNWAPLTLVGDTANAVAGIHLYWVRVRISAIGASGADCWITGSHILSDWVGHRKVFGVLNSVSGVFGQKFVYGQDAALNALWITPAGGTGWGVSSRNQRLRDHFLDFQGTCLHANGNTQRRFDGLSWRDLGFLAPAFSVSAATNTAGPPQFGRACIFSYYMTVGYGPGGSWGESSPTLIGQATMTNTEFAALTWTFSTQPSDDATVLHIYRSADETGTPASAAGSLPAFRIASIDRPVGGVFPTSLSGGDSVYAFPVPSQPMDDSDRTPPGPCKFIDELRGRVLLAASDEFPNRGWWSHTGEGEAYDQEEQYVELKKPIIATAVAFDTWFLWSEDEMVAVSDLDEDIPNIYDVPGGVGAVADAAKSRYGVVMWPSRDGVYAMGPDFKPERVTGTHNQTFGKMSVETHGGSWALFYDSCYHIHLLDRDGVPVGSTPAWRFDLLWPHWNTVDTSLSPLATIVAPFGHADEGVEHPIFGNVNLVVNDRIPRVGEYTTTDDGVGYPCIADIHFGPSGFRKFRPRRASFYFQNDGGWATPVVSNAPGHTTIFKGPTSYGTPTPKVGSDYSLIVANPTDAPSGTQDIVVRFAATTQAGGSVGGQRLVAGYFDGEILEIHPTG